MAELRLQTLVSGDFLSSVHVFVLSRSHILFSGIAAAKQTTASMTSNTGMRGTPLYMAPEMLRSEAYGAAADVYSFAVLCWELFACAKPFPQNWNHMDLLNKVGVGDTRPSPMPVDMPATVQQLVMQCWARDSKARPKMLEVVQQLEILTK